MNINKHNKTLQLLFSLLALSLLVACEKYDRNNPWDENANFNPDDWALENLDIEYVSISERKLTWDYSGDERFDGFKIDRKIGEEDWNIAYGTAYKDATSWNDSDILPDTTLTYQYRIYAYAGNNNFTSSSVSFVPDFPAPSNLKVEKQPDSDIAYKLSWTSNSTGEQGFKIDRKTTGGDWVIAFDSVPGNHTEYVDTNVFFGKSTIDVHYRVYAYYLEYETKKISTETEATLPAPSNLEITVNSITSASLSWQDNSTGEEGFKVERKAAGGQWKEVATTQENTFDDHEFELNTEISYRVSAYIGDYSSDYAENSFDSSIPPPTNLEIRINSTTSLSLTWQNNAIGEEGFKIDRKLGNDDWEIDYASVSANEISYTDNDIDLVDNQYFYRIYAYYGAYSSDYDEAEYIPLQVSTNEVTNITQTSATSGGFVIGSHVDSRGIAYGTSPNPSISGNTVPAGSGAGSFTANITGLTPITSYYIRAYATNNVGTVYGDNLRFITQANLPTIVTNKVTNITGSSATGGGNVTSDGGATVNARGLAYSTSPNPTVFNNTVPSGSGTGSFTANITGLTSNTTYHVRAYATNNTGIAYGTNVTFKTLDSFPCGTNITFMYKGQQVTYGTVSRGGLCWLDRNLGADPMPFVPADDATGNTDTRLYGDLFQWGRLDDNHQDRTSSTTPGPINQDVPGHGNFITVGSDPYDWRSPQNDNLWQGEDGINNSCPEGWRLPTDSELNAERLSWDSNNSDGAYASALKWPVGGYRFSSGTLSDTVGIYGFAWSSSVSGAHASYLRFKSSDADINSYNRARGMSVRCVREL